MQLLQNYNTRTFKYKIYILSNYDRKNTTLSLYGAFSSHYSSFSKVAIKLPDERGGFVVKFDCETLPFLSECWKISKMGKNRRRSGRLKSDSGERFLPAAVRLNAIFKQAERGGTGLVELLEENPHWIPEKSRAQVVDRAHKIMIKWYQDTSDSARFESEFLGNRYLHALNGFEKEGRRINLPTKDLADRIVTYQGNGELMHSDLDAFYETAFTQALKGEHVRAIHLRSTPISMAYVRSKAAIKMDFVKRKTVKFTVENAQNLARHIRTIRDEAYEISNPNQRYNVNSSRRVSKVSAYDVIHFTIHHGHRKIMHAYAHAAEPVFFMTPSKLDIDRVRGQMISPVYLEEGMKKPRRAYDVRQELITAK
jgi:hypothetical protein